MLFISKVYQNSARIWLIKLLYITGIRKSGCKENCSKLKIFLSRILQPFAIFLHFSFFYSALVLTQSSHKGFMSREKSRLGSIFTSILSLIIWHVVYTRRCKIFSVLNLCYGSLTRISFSNSYYKNSNSKYIWKFKGLFILISLNFSIPLILSSYVAFLVSKELFYSYATIWFFAHNVSETEYINRMLVFFALLTYFTELIFFPTLFLLIFCFSLLRLAIFLEQNKNILKTLCIWKNNILKHSTAHEEILKIIKFHEEIFSFPIFLQLIFMTSIGFTGTALEFELDNRLHVHFIEGMLYLYISTLGIASVTYVASKIFREQEEILKIYRYAYEDMIGRGETQLTPPILKKLAILKVIYERPVVYLTAWKITRLDRKLVFTMFGIMFTYGFLIIQLK